jgi:hypothetical protein
VHKSARFRVVVALLIALTSLLGALAAWRAEAASIKGDSAERKGYAQNVAAERWNAQIRGTLQSTLLNYQRAQVSLTLAKALRTEAGTSAPADAARLRAEARADESLGNQVLTQVDPDALNPNGSLNLKRQYTLQQAVARSSEDIESKDEYLIADHQAKKSERLVGLTALLIAAAFFFTLVPVGRRRATIPIYLGGGLVVLVSATVLLLIVVFAT